MARGRGTGKKSGSKPTTSRRAYVQDVRDRYAKAREEAQLLGLIPTKPEEALKPEQVDPATQSEAPQVALVAEALRRGWEVPEHRKPDLVDELMKIAADSEVQAKTRVAAFNALRMADQQQWERDHPKAAAALRGMGAQVNVSNTTNVQNNVAVGEVFDDIKVLEASFERIIGGEARGKEEGEPSTQATDAEAARGVRANGDAQPVDEAQPYLSQEEPEAD